MIAIDSPLIETDLVRYYKRFRRKYYLRFGLEMPLPSKVTLRFAPIAYPEGENHPKDPPEAEWRTEDGLEFFITIQPYVANHFSAAKVAVLHEMAHINLYLEGIPSGHGKPFQAEIDRLYRLGAYRKLL